MDLSFTEIQEVGLSGTDWLVYEQGRYRQPLCLLSNHQVLRLIRMYAKAHPAEAAQAVEEAAAARAPAGEGRT